MCSVEKLVNVEKKRKEINNKLLVNFNDVCFKLNWNYPIIIIIYNTHLLWSTVIRFRELKTRNPKIFTYTEKSKTIMKCVHVLLWYSAKDSEGGGGRWAKNKLSRKFIMWSLVSSKLYLAGSLQHQLNVLFQIISKFLVELYLIWKLRTRQIG